MIQNPPITQPPIESPTPKKRSFWKSCGLVALILVLLIGGGYGYLTYRFKTAKDIAPINDSDLQPAKISISDDENSYFELVKIKDVIYYPKEKEQQDKITQIEEGKTWDENFVKDLVAKNTDALNYLNEFDQKPKFVDPALTDPGKVDVNTLTLSGTASSIRQIAKIQSLESLLLLKGGKSDQAFDENLKILRLSYKLTNYQPALIPYLLGLATANIGWSRLDSIVSTGDLSSEFLQSKKEDLIKLKSTKEGLKTAMKFEYIIMTKSITEDIGASPEELKKAAQSNLPLDKMSPSFYFQPNRTKQMYADWTREQIKQSDLQCDKITTSSIPDISKQSKVKLFLTENAIGKILINMTTVSLSNLQNKRCETEKLADQAINKFK